MDKLASGSKARLMLARESGVPISAADEARITASVQVSLEALAIAIPGSLFDTEPAHFERLLKNKAGNKAP
jgi:hypothetical protein